MRFGEAIEKTEGLRFVADSLEIMSEPGRVCLMNSTFITSGELLEEKLSHLDKMMEVIAASELAAAIRSHLMTLRNISSTIGNLESGKTLDDVDLFEIKGLALLGTHLKKLLSPTPLSAIREVQIPDLEAVVEILDPENSGNTNFHIYNAYSPALEEKRALLRKLQLQKDYDEEESARFISECMELENEIRDRLSGCLRPYARALGEALRAMGELDLMMAKAEMASELRLCRPQVASGHTEYTELSYLPLVSALRESGRKFQPVSLTLKQGVTLITGANMGGKSITLKSLALAQTMMQFGFFVPAEKALIMPVEEICVSLGDMQSEGEGLSSYGSEILRLDTIIRKAGAGEKLLVLVDEPARTTNPDEGRAIATAIVAMLQESYCLAVVTTHYSNIEAECRRLRVKGVAEKITEARGIGPQALADYMDYSLIPDEGLGSVREALRIGKMLGISEKFAEEIEKRII